MTHHLQSDRLERLYLAAVTAYCAMHQAGLHSDDIHGTLVTLLDPHSSEDLPDSSDATPNELQFSFEYGNTESVYMRLGYTVYRLLA